MTVIFSGSNNNRLSSRWRCERWHWVDEVQGGLCSSARLGKKNYIRTTTYIFSYFSTLIFTSHRVVL